MPVVKAASPRKRESNQIRRVEPADAPSPKVDKLNPLGPFCGVLFGPPEVDEFGAVGRKTQAETSDVTSILYFLILL